ncbi:MAG: twin-arginine translocase subunit TatC [Lysobacterales bacterium]
MTSAEGAPEQSLIAHLVELRTRLLRAILVLLGVFLALVPFANRLYQMLAQPVLAKLPAGTTMIAVDIATPFITPLKLTFFVALLVTMPWLLYQLWAFVAPGLYRHEQKLATPLLASSVLLFYAGCAFAYFLVLPAVFAFLTAVAPQGVAVMPDINHYLDFVLVLFFAFGVCFEIPVAVVILVALGVVDVPKLKRARPYVIVGAFVAGAILTPPDVISQILLAVPIWILYEVGILFARSVKPGERPARADA